MDNLFEKREYVLRFYTKYSRYIDKLFQFVLALLTFAFINSNVGFMKMASSPIVTLGMAVVCTVLPRTFTVVFASLLTLVQFYSFSLGGAAIVAAIFVLMFILYFRFTPSKTIVLLLVPIAFMLKMPALAAITYGLIGTPVCIIPVSMGTIVYFMISYVKTYVNTIGTSGKADLVGQMTSFVQQLFSNKELWIAVAALTICMLIVYSIRRMSIDNSWIAAIITGGIVYIVAVSLGNVMMKTHISYVAVIVGSIVSSALALILQFIVFSVDYSRTEYLQFEDDEYYYYVKAVPKVTMTVPEKTVKRINERQDTTMIDSESVKESLKHPKKMQKKQSENLVVQQADEMMLAKTLQEELDIQKIIEDELNID